MQIDPTVYFLLKYLNLHNVQVAGTGGRYIFVFGGINRM